METPHRFETIQDGIARFLAGALPANQLKPFLAPSGIYEQRDGRFMLRVRVTGGHITTQALRQLADVMDRNGISSAHLSSRQCIQLHHVPVEKIISSILDCEAAGLPFKGGGGNTYRNILASADSGFGEQQVFDVLPYAQYANTILSGLPESFELPRKFKIGFFSNPGDEFTAACQDLGFQAVLSGGQKGFIVYGGGGMGRESATGVKLFDFLPHDQFIHCTLAMLHLFNEHGDRANRHSARLRFVLKKEGADSFTRLFHSYFEKTPCEPVNPPALPAFAPPPRITTSNPSSAEFSTWRYHAVTPTHLGAEQVAVRLYIPYGNITSEQIRKLAGLAETFSSGVLRLMPTQDLLMAPVHTASLPALHERLLNDFPELDVVLASFRGHLCTCVGATVCKIGILSAPALADSLAGRLDTLLPADTPEKLVLLRRITDDIRISGCLNSCSGHPAAWLGLQGQKRRAGTGTEDIVLPFTDRSTMPGSFKLASHDGTAGPIRAEDLPAFVAQAIGWPPR